MTISTRDVTSGGIGRLPDVPGGVEVVSGDGGALQKCQIYRAVIFKALCSIVFVISFRLRLELNCWHERVIRWIPSTPPTGPTRKVTILDPDPWTSKVGSLP